MERKIIYFDNNATTPVAPEVLESMLPFLKDYYGNPSSIHFFGGQVKKYMEKAREEVADFLSCEPEEIIFTSSGSESNNFAIKGLAEAYPDKNHIITTEVEHPSLKITMEYMKKKGYKIDYLKVNRKGELEIEELERLISEKTLLVSVMWVNNETGNIYPVEKIAQICKEKEVFFHTDAVQAAGKISINLKEYNNIDLLSLSGHKLHAPKGIGVLFVRKGLRLVPLIHGGHHEKARRAGTENVPYIVGLGTACKIIKGKIFQENEKIQKMRDALENGIMQRISDVRVNGREAPRVSNTTNIGFYYVEGESILMMLSDKRICASSGSACSSGSLRPSHVLLAMNVPLECIHGSIRFSLSRYNSMEEVEYTLEVLPDIIEKLREISPFGK